MHNTYMNWSLQDTSCMATKIILTVLKINLRIFSDYFCQIREAGSFDDTGSEASPSELKYSVDAKSNQPK